MWRLRSSSFGHDVLDWTFRVRVPRGMIFQPADHLGPTLMWPAGVRGFGASSGRGLLSTGRGTPTCFDAIHSAILARQLRERGSAPFSPDQVGGLERGEDPTRGHELETSKRQAWHRPRLPRVWMNECSTDWQCLQRV
jgi:hypothetical protein